jgi:hypothetical protein
MISILSPKRPGDHENQGKEPRTEAKRENLHKLIKIDMYRAVEPGNLRVDAYRPGDRGFSVAISTTGRNFLL